MREKVKLELLTSVNYDEEDVPVRDFLSTRSRDFQMWDSVEWARTHYILAMRQFLLKKGGRKTTIVFKN